MKQRFFMLLAAFTLVLGIGLYQAKRADAKPYTYCTTWQWITEPGWCSWYVTCGPTFWVNYGGQWYQFDYCGNRLA